jgi:hypothetical protein
MDDPHPLQIFTGNANRVLAQKIADYFGLCFRKLLSGRGDLC